MPIYENRPDIPGPLLRSLTSEEYSEDLQEHFDELPKAVQDHHRENHFSVTTLIASPRQRVLFNRHHMKVLVNPARNMRKLLGMAVHSLLERFPDPGDIIEKREGMSIGAHNQPGLLKGLRRNGSPIRSMYIHGKPDVFNPLERRITDYKTTSAIGMIYGDKMEHQAQLNVLALILRGMGHFVDRLTNEYLFFDWKEADFNKLQEKGYPKEDRMTKEVPIWKDKDLQEFVNLKLRAHLEAEMLPDDEIPHCTQHGPMGIDELWMSDPEFKIYKVDLNKKTNERKVQVKAKHTSASMAEAQAWAGDPMNAFDAKGSIEYQIKEIQSAPKKCEYCLIKSFCNQYRARQAQSQPEETEA